MRFIFQLPPQPRRLPIITTTTTTTPNRSRHVPRPRTASLSSTGPCSRSHTVSPGVLRVHQLPDPRAFLSAECLPMLISILFVLMYHEKWVSAQLVRTSQQRGPDWKRSGSGNERTALARSGRRLQRDWKSRQERAIPILCQRSNLSRSIASDGLIRAKE